MIFFYEFLFVMVALGAVLIGEVWSRLAACVFLGVWFAIAVVGCASFDARLATANAPGQGLREEDRQWFTDARDGLRHLRLLFGLATVVALVWRVVAG